MVFVAPKKWVHLMTDILICLCKSDLWWNAEKWRHMKFLNFKFHMKREFNQKCLIFGNQSHL